MFDDRNSQSAATGPGQGKAGIATLALGSSAAKLNMNKTQVIPRHPEASVESKSGSVVARLAPRKLMQEGFVPSGYLWDVLLRVSDLAASQRKKVAIFTVEGVAGMGKSALGEIITRFGLPGYKPPQIRVMETDNYLPDLCDSPDGKPYLRRQDGEQFSSNARSFLKAVDWKGFLADFERQKTGAQVVFLVGLYGMYFYAKLERPDPPAARILIQGPDELALLQAMKRDGADSKHAVSLKVRQRIKEDFLERYVYVNVDARRPWLERPRQPLKTKSVVNSA